jgi:hypothetical protein
VGGVVGQGGEMTQTMYAHVNKRIKKRVFNILKIFSQEKKSPIKLGIE